MWLVPGLMVSYQLLRCEVVRRVIFSFTSRSEIRQGRRLRALSRSKPDQRQPMEGQLMNRCISVDRSIIIPDPVQA